jgi:hypothetical protein
MTDCTLTAVLNLSWGIFFFWSLLRLSTFHRYKMFFFAIALLFFRLCFFDDESLCSGSGVKDYMIIVPFSLLFLVIVPVAFVIELNSSIARSLNQTKKD